MDIEKLPEWMKSYAENFALIECEMNGYDPRTPEGKTFLEKRRKNFLQSALKESITPHMNPWKPRVAKDLWNAAVGIFGNQGFFSQGFAQGKELQGTMRSLKSSVMNQALIYFRTTKTSGEKGPGSNKDFGYQTSPGGEAGKELRHDVDLNRDFRIAVTMIIAASYTVMLAVPRGRLFDVVKEFKGDRKLLASKFYKATLRILTRSFGSNINTFVDELKKEIVQS